MLTAFARILTILFTIHKCFILVCLHRKVVTFQSENCNILYVKIRRKQLMFKWYREMFFILQRRTVNTNNKVLSTVYVLCIRVNMNLPIYTYLHVLSEAQSCKWKRNIANKHDELIIVGGGDSKRFWKLYYVGNI